MSSTPPLGVQSIRSLALVGQTAAGKTSLAEALLHRAGRIGAPGSLERGTTVSDFDPLERRYQHSLNAAVMHLQHRDTRIHLIDTPGAAGLPRPVDDGARGGRDRGHRDQREHRHRDDGRAHDGLGGQARPVPHDHRQQDRRRSGVDLPALLAQTPGRLRQGMPAAEPAGRRRHEGGRLLLQPRTGRGRFRLGRRGAPRAGRAGGRGRPRLRRALPERRRRRPGRAARAARAGAARRPPDPDLLRLGAQRRRRGRAARRDRQAAAQPDRRQPAATS